MYVWGWGGGGRVLGYKGVGFGLEDAAGLRKLWSVQGKGGSEGGRDSREPWTGSEGQGEGA